MREFTRWGETPENFMEPPLDRAEGRLNGLCDFLVRQLLVVSEDEHRLQVFGETLDRASHPVGLLPRLGHVRRTWIARRKALDRLRKRCARMFAAAMTQVVLPDQARDSVEPRGKGTRGIVSVALAVHRHQGLFGQVLDDTRRTPQAVKECEEGRLPACEEKFQGALLAISHPHHELSIVGHAAPRGHPWRSCRTRSTPRQAVGPECAARLGGVAPREHRGTHPLISVGGGQKV